MPSDSIGYGKPPKHSRFKPGQSGNPKGRPKGKLPLARMIEKYLDGKMAVTIGTEQKTVSRREGLVMAFVSDALKGKDKVRKQLLDLLLLLESQNPPEAAGEVSDTQDDATILGLLNRYGINPAPPASHPTKTIKIIKAKKPEAQK